MRLGVSSRFAVALECREHTRVRETRNTERGMSNITRPAKVQHGSYSIFSSCPPSNQAKHVHPPCLLHYQSPPAMRTQEDVSDLKPRSGPSPEPDHAGSQFLDSQPPELWEINPCCLQAQLMVLCYNSLKGLRRRD